MNAPTSSSWPSLSRQITRATAGTGPALPARAPSQRLTPLLCLRGTTGYDAPELSREAQTIFCPPVRLSAQGQKDLFRGQTIGVPSIALSWEGRGVFDYPLPLTHAGGAVGRSENMLETPIDNVGQEIGRA